MLSDKNLIARAREGLSEIKHSSADYSFRNCRIKNFAYPKGVRLAINVTLDFDAQLRRRLYNEPILQLTKGEFGGRVGIWRLLKLFEKHDIKTTIFTVGRICELYPESLKEAAKKGHEIANHMWEHRVPPEPDLEKDHLVKATMAIEQLCGKKPFGTRSRHKISLLNQEGYIYTSHDAADDLPYYVMDSESKQFMLNLPFHYVLDDAMFFNFGWVESESAGQRLEAPGKVYDIWVSAFKRQYKMGSYMNIVVHPFISGRSLRIAMLDRLLGEIKQMPGVWFPTCEKLARYCIEKYPPESH